MKQFRNGTYDDLNCEMGTAGVDNNVNSIGARNKFSKKWPKINGRVTIKYFFDGSHSASGKRFHIVF